ncbi:MAG: lysophospholipid acyltransferase family protein [Halanaerobium sp.]|nr:lysophospholipid acyltransferase family protein [Halanaerobium sp.]
MARIPAFLFCLFSPLAWKVKASNYLSDSFSQFFNISYHLLRGRFETQIFRAKVADLNEVSNLVAIKGKEQLERARAAGKGIILVTIHSPCFRIIQHWSNQQEGLETWLIKHLFMQEDQARNRLARFLHQQQLEIYQGRILDGNKIGDMKRAVRILAAGGSIIVCQDVGSSTAAPVRFMGRQKRYPLGASKLAEMGDAIILPLVITNRTETKDWLIHFWPTIEPGDNSRQQLLDTMEEMILSYPEAWALWSWVI